MINYILIGLAVLAIFLILKKIVDDYLYFKRFIAKIEKAMDKMDQFNVLGGIDLKNATSVNNNLNDKYRDL